MQIAQDLSNENKQPLGEAVEEKIEPAHQAIEDARDGIARSRALSQAEADLAQASSGSPRNKLIPPISSEAAPLLRTWGQLRLTLRPWIRKGPSGEAHASASSTGKAVSGMRVGGPSRPPIFSSVRVLSEPSLPFGQGSGWAA